VRRRVPHLAGLDLEEEQIGVAGQLAEPLGHDPAPVRRDPVDGEVAAQLEDALLPALQLPRDDLEVTPVAAVRRVHEQPALPRDDRRPMVEARIDDERLGLSAPLQHVQLRPLVAARVDRKQHPAVRQQRPVDGLGQVGQLLRLSALGGDEEELPHARPVGGDQQRRAVPRESERPRLFQLEERPQILERSHGEAH
jgi:hypothetical protein